VTVISYTRTHTHTHTHKETTNFLLILARSLHWGLIIVNLSLRWGENLQRIVQKVNRHAVPCRHSQNELQRHYQKESARNVTISAYFPTCSFCAVRALGSADRLLTLIFYVRPLSAGNRSNSAKYITLSTGDFYDKLSIHTSSHLERTVLTTTLREAVTAFLSA
jgi:hypothetical protein